MFGPQMEMLFAQFHEVAHETRFEVVNPQLVDFVVHRGTFGRGSSGRRNAGGGGEAARSGTLHGGLEQPIIGT